jgi:hypothetical protein
MYAQIVATKVATDLTAFAFRGSTKTRRHFKLVDTKKVSLFARRDPHLLIGRLSVIPFVNPLVTVRAQRG